MDALQKITEAQMDANGVCSAPNVLNGTVAQNKAVFDKMVRQLVAPAYNAAVDAIGKINATETGIQAAEALRVTAETGRVTAENARAAAEIARESTETGYVAQAAASAATAVAKSGEAALSATQAANSAASASESANRAAQVVLGQIPDASLTMAKMAPSVTSLFHNRNLLDNWDFRNPVNQRGQASYTGFGVYTIDRWLVGSNRNTVSIDSTGVTLTSLESSAEHWVFYQYVDNYAQYGEKTVTFSVDVSNLSGSFRVLLSDGVSDVAKEITADGIHSITTIISASNTMLRVLILNNSTIVNTCKLIRAKLELGSVSTLANDPPADYGAELTKCQRYFATNAVIGTGEISGIAAQGIGSTELYSSLVFPVPMRTIPSATIKAVWNWSENSGWTNLSLTSEFYASAETMSRYGISYVRSIGHTCQDNQLYLIQYEATADL